jgi:vacuolar-type H+-ATPase subunit E/Vma4
MQRSIKEESKEEVDDPKPKKIKQVYSIRDVIKKNHRDLIQDEIPFKSTDKEYIGSYQRAVTTVLNNMDEKELEEAEKVLDLWNKQGAPEEVQCK